MLFVCSSLLLRRFRTSIKRRNGIFPFVLGTKSEKKNSRRFSKRVLRKQNVFAGCLHAFGTFSEHWACNGRTGDCAMCTSILSMHLFQMLCRQCGHFQPSILPSPSSLSFVTSSQRKVAHAAFFFRPMFPPLAHSLALNPWMKTLVSFQKLTAKSIQFAGAENGAILDEPIAGARQAQATARARQPEGRSPQATLPEPRRPYHTG